MSDTMEIHEIKDILEKNCYGDQVLIAVTNEFFKIESSNDKKYNKRYDEVIEKFYDER